MTSKVHLAVLFGGQSSEHEVSVVSARSMLAAMNQERYDLTLIGIARDGSWWTGAAEILLSCATVDEVVGNCVRVTPDFTDHGVLIFASSGRRVGVDCYFPLLHGPCGEDGTIQGAFELANVAYVGCGVAASAVSMDKSLTKKVLNDHDLPQVAHAEVDYADWNRDREHAAASAMSDLNYPVFVKPANMGSSVGVTRASGDESLQTALEIAFNFDQRVLVESAVSGCREIECSVLGYQTAQTSVLGEIIPGSDFYDYETKYENDRSTLVIPANLSADLTQRMRTMAETTFHAVGGAGLARVDFFLSDRDEVFVNEINTMPGFTPISMYPKLWAASGLDYPDLVDRLIDLARQRHADRQRLKKTR